MHKSTVRFPSNLIIVCDVYFFLKYYHYYFCYSTTTTQMKLNWQKAVKIGEIEEKLWLRPNVESTINQTFFR